MSHNYRINNVRFAFSPFQEEIFNVKYCMWNADDKSNKEKRGIPESMD